MIKLSGLRLNESNPRYIKDSQFDRLVKSIEKFPRMLELRPIVVDQHSTVVGGNMRYRALEHLGYVEVDDSWIKRVEDFTEAELREFIIKDNLAFGDWDWDELANSWDEQDLTDWGLDFPDFALESGLDEEPKVEDEDEVEKLLEDVGKVESRVNPGEIWQLGRHKIACGDSTIESNVIALLGDQFDEVGMVWADPPYGISIVANNGFVGGGEAYDYPFGGLKNIKNKGDASDNSPKVVKAKKYAPIIGDATTNTAVNSFVISFSLFEKATHFWWGGNYYASSMPDTSCWIVWDKENTCNFADAELAWSNHKSAVRIFKHMWNGMVKASEHGQKRVHPTQKPIALCEWVFEKYGTPDDVIFDPFLGSAPSIIAAQKMEGDRTVYGFELSPDYCEVIIKRFEQFTGDTAKLVGSLSQ